MGDDLMIYGTDVNSPDGQLSPWTQWEQDMLDKQYEAMIAGEWEPTARQFYTGNSSARPASHVRKRRF